MTFCCLLSTPDEDEVEESVDGSGGGPSSMSSSAGGHPPAGGAGSGPGGNFPRPDDNASNLKAFQSRLEDLKTCNDLIVKHAAALHKSLAELEAVDSSKDDLVSRMKTVNERATLFRISSNAMVNVSTLVGRRVRRMRFSGRFGRPNVVGRMFIWC